MAIEFSITRRITCLANETVSYEADEEDIKKRMDNGLSKEQALQEAVVEGACIRVGFDIEVDEVTMEHESNIDC